MNSNVPISVTKILLVEDNAGDKRLVLEAFREIADIHSEIVHCQTLAQALAVLEGDRPDVALIDLGLPDAQGLEAVSRIHSVAPEVPLVVLTVLSDESLGVQALKEGAQDYLIKTHIDWRTIWRALCYAIERQRLQVEILNLSLSDDLTGLYNRRGFLTLTQHQIKVAYRTGKPFLVGFGDVDRMKEINDAFGHQEGNHALVDTANILRDSFRQSDILARIGGDEFAMFVTDATQNTVKTVTHRLQQKLDLCNTDPSRRYQLSFSVGIVAAGGADRCDIEELLRQADVAMYEKKQSKRPKRPSIRLVAAAPDGPPATR
jgi:diguanylate cyclase (GGDEF)-like protein